MARYRSFVLHLHCSNCQRPSAKTVTVPVEEGAPSTIEEFAEALESQPAPFNCRHCDSLIGTLVGISMEKQDEAA